MQGHRCLCEECAQPYLKQLKGKTKPVQCPLCRMLVENIMLTVFD
jgi:hypothetical protein